MGNRSQHRKISQQVVGIGQAGLLGIGFVDQSQVVEIESRHVRDR